MNKKNTKFIKSKNISLLFRSFFYLYNIYINFVMNKCQNICIKNQDIHLFKCLGFLYIYFDICTWHISLYTETRIAKHGQTGKSFSFTVLVSLLGAQRNSQKDLFSSPKNITQYLFTKRASHSPLENNNKPEVIQRLLSCLIRKKRNGVIWWKKNFSASTEKLGR